MRKKVLLDTGVLVAFINKKENLHSWAIEQWKIIEPHLLTCEGVITETCFLLQDVYKGQDAVINLISRKIIQIPFQLNDDSETIRQLLQRYQNVPMSLADACLVRMTELIAGSCVLTLDRDFLVYRQNKNQIIDLIIPTQL